MLLQAALLANAASQDANGLVSFLGGFVDTIIGPQLPIRHQVSFVARLIVEPHDFGRDQKVAVKVESPDGSDVLVRIEGTTRPELAAMVDPEMPVAALVLLPLPLEFRETGVFVVSLTVNDVQLWMAPLRAKLGHAGPQA